jgi:hypothetical protein
MATAMPVAYHMLPYLLLIVAVFTNARLELRAETTRYQDSSAFPDPKTVYRAYMEAVRKNDLKAANACFVMDYDNQPSAIGVFVGLWVSTRQLNQIAVKTFGMDGTYAIPKKWRGEDVSDRALDLTRKRLESAELIIKGNSAELRIKWEKDDGYPNEAFEFTDGPIPFRKVKAGWKIDGNKMTGLKRGEDFFEAGSWGPLLRDQVGIMNDAFEGIQKGQIATPKQLQGFIDSRMKAMIKKYESENLKKPGK